MASWKGSTTKKIDRIVYWTLMAVAIIYFGHGLVVWYLNGCPIRP